jgi:hypothetical protein
MDTNASLCAKKKRRVVKNKQLIDLGENEQDDDANNLIKHHEYGSQGTSETIRVQLTGEGR